MNPYVNISLNDSHITRPRVINNSQHQSASLLGGAAAFNSYSSQQYTPQTHLYEPRQDGFSEAPQVFCDTQEKLDDVRTWGIDTIRQVATDLYHNPHQALFGHHDKFDDGQELFGVTYCPGGDLSCGYGDLPRSSDSERPRQ